MQQYRIKHQGSASEFFIIDFSKARDVQTMRIAHSYYNYGILVSYFYFHGGN